jgi:hypothetical protein
MLRRVAVILVFHRFSYAVAFLANPVVALAVPKGVNKWVFVLAITGRTENFYRVFVAVVAVTIATVFIAI